MRIKPDKGLKGLPRIRQAQGVLVTFPFQKRLKKQHIGFLIVYDEYPPAEQVFSRNKICHLNLPYPGVPRLRPLNRGAQQAA